MNVGRFCITGLIAFLFIYTNSTADEQTELSVGQTIYVPAYSHIYSGDRERVFLLTVTLSIRNTDLKNPIELYSVKYMTQGKLLKKMIVEPILLKPLESVRYIVPESDKKGGAGAHFMIQWTSDRPVNQPIVESIMIGAQNQQGISFVSRGQVVIRPK